MSWCLEWEFMSAPGVYCAAWVTLQKTHRVSMHLRIVSGNLLLLPGDSATAGGRLFPSFSAFRGITATCWKIQVVGACWKKREYPMPSLDVGLYQADHLARNKKTSCVINLTPKQPQKPHCRQTSLDSDVWLRFDITFNIVDLYNMCICIDTV